MRNVAKCVYAFRDLFFCGFDTYDGSEKTFYNGGNIMFQISLFKQIRRVLLDDCYMEEKEAWLEECKDTKLWKLWQILFETDVRNRALLESRIYEYGSQIKETEYMHRDIFIWLVAFLNLVIK